MPKSVRANKDDDNSSIASDSNHSSRYCNKCGEIGHKSVNCSKSDKKQRSGENIKVKSLTTKDEAKQDKPLYPRHKNTICTFCKELGHIQANCPKRDSEKDIKVRSLTNEEEENYDRDFNPEHANKICNTCGELGHVKFDCPLMEKVRFKIAEERYDGKCKFCGFGMIIKYSIFKKITLLIHYKENSR